MATADGSFDSWDGGGWDDGGGRDDARRLRRRVWIVAAVAAATVAALVVIPRLDGGERMALVGAGAGAEASTTEPAPGFVAGQPAGTRLDFSAPPGWQTLVAAGETMVVATRPLSEADRALALLARDDVVFKAFPADGVVVVVGGDPVQAKYLGGPDSPPIGPGPAYALGDEKVLAGGVRVRRGDIPQSIVRIASYAGPSAPADRLREAEAIAAGVRLVRTGDPSVPPPPPLVGSRPGMPNGTLPVPEAGLPEVARTPASGSTLVLVAGRDCAYLRWVDAQPSLTGYQPLAGVCGTRPTGPVIETYGVPVLVMRGPNSAASTVVTFRFGPSVARVTARLADGRTVPATVGADGWGLVATDGRIVAVTGFDLNGRALPETLVA